MESINPSSRGGGGEGGFGSNNFYPDAQKARKQRDTVAPGIVKFIHSPHFREKKSSLTLTIGVG